MKNEIKVIQYGNKESDDRLVQYIQKTGICFLGVFGAVATLYSSMSKLDVVYSVLAIMALAESAVYVAVLSGKRRKTAFSIVTSVMGVLALINYKKIRDGFIALADCFNECALESEYMLPYDFSEYDYCTSKDICILVVSFYLMAVLCTFIGLFLARGKGMFISVALVFMVSILGIFVDLEPNLFYFTMSLAFCIGAVAYANMKGVPISFSLSRMYSTVALVVAMSLVIMLVVPEDARIRNKKLMDIKNTVENKVMSVFEIAYNKIMGKTGKFDNGNLSNGHTQLRYDEETDLIVTVYESMNGPIYLKSYTGQKYKNGRWSNANLEKFEYSEEFNGDFFGFNVKNRMLNNSVQAGYAFNTTAREIREAFILQEMRIERTKDTRHLTFLPYSSYSYNQSYRNDPEMTILNTTEDMYELSVIQDFGPLAKDYDAYDSFLMETYTRYDENLYIIQKSYEKYLKQEYLDVPDGALPDDLLYELGIDDGDTVWEASEAIIRYFEEEFTYALKTEKPDWGTDVLYHFVTEGKKGYCMHFASAATLLLRQIGVPARYAEGYVITQDMIDEAPYDRNSVFPLKKIEVPDSKAHAWVEVFITSVGWVPIEVTPGYINDYTPVGSDRETESETRAPQPTQVTTKAPAETQTQTETVPESQENTKETITSPSEVQSGGSGTEGDSGKTQKAHNEILIVTFGILAIALICVIVYIYRKNRLKRLLSDENTDFSKKRVIMLYRYMERLLFYLDIVKEDSMSYIEYRDMINSKCRFAKDIDFVTVFDYVLENSYSGHVITEKEVKLLIEQLKKLSKCIYSQLGILQRFTYSVILNLKV